MLVDEPGFPYSRHEYESFREYLQREVRIDIPIHGWNHWFIRFGPNGTVKAILSKKPWIGQREVEQKTWELLGAYSTKGLTNEIFGLNRAKDRKIS